MPSPIVWPLSDIRSSNGITSSSPKGLITSHANQLFSLSVSLLKSTKNWSINFTYVSNTMCGKCRRYLGILMLQTNWATSSAKLMPLLSWRLNDPFLYRVSPKFKMNSRKIWYGISVVPIFSTRSGSPSNVSPYNNQC